MLINVAAELKKARSGGYAIGAFNTSNLEVTKAICVAAKKYDKFILIQTTPGAIDYAGLQTLFDIVRDEIKSSGVRAAIHLDHGKDWEVAKACIDTGYPSVMIDGSKLPYDQNVALTKKVADYAHARGVSVEGEIGVLGIEEGGRSGTRDSFSSPKQTIEFVQATDVDSVAIAIGNAHGAPENESLNLKLLEEIAKEIAVPLVLHGSSGLSNNDICEAIRFGVAKFNIDTNIRRVFTSAIKKSQEDDPREVMKEGMAEVEEVVERYIRLFSNKIKT